MEARTVRVLLVDDDRRNARLLARMLREDGFVVEVLLGGAAAVGRLARDPLPDAIITELRMPHVDGIAVARFARSRRPDVCVMFLTGYPNLLAEVRCFDPEPLIYTKPVNYASLSAALLEVDPKA